MPTGKEPWRGALLDRVTLSDIDIHEDFLEAVQPAHERLPWDEPGPVVRDQIREVLEMYFACHLGAPPQTRTERAPLVTALADAVASYLRDGPNAEVVARISRHLDQLGPSWRSQLDASLRRAEHTGRVQQGSARSFFNWPLQVAAAVRFEESGLSDRVGSAVPWPRVGERCLPIVLEFCHARLEGRRERDPYLRGLVSDLAPMWERLTGRTRLARDAEDVCLFGEWLVKLVSSAKITVERELEKRFGGSSRKPCIGFTSGAVRALIQAQRSVK